MMMRKILLGTVAVSLVIGSVATAAFASPKGGKDGMHALGPMAGPGMFVFMLKNFDANKDGKIAADEAKAGADDLFVKIDTDKDGAVIPKEMRSWHEARMQAIKASMKGAGAGEDQGAGPEGMDGPDGMGGPDGGNGKHHGYMKMYRHHGKGHGGMGGQGMMKTLDTDENGQISKAEAEAGAASLVTRMDTNKDGVVSIDDFPG